MINSGSGPVSHCPYIPGAKLVPFHVNFWAQISLQMVLHVPFDCLDPVALLFGPDCPLGSHLDPCLWAIKSLCKHRLYCLMMC